MELEWIEAIKRLRPDAFDFIDDNAQIFAEETHCRVNELIAEYMDATRDFVLASRAAGVDTSVLVQLYGDDSIPLTGKARHAQVKAHFVGGERSVRIGGRTAARAIQDSEVFGRNVVSTFAPWLSDVGPVDD